MTNGRIEAFSDGVFAVAITLLVLDLRVPNPAHLDGSLAHALGEEWPSYAAYAVSFLVLGIIWVNHHAVMGLMARVDRTLAFINIGLLMTVVLIPFGTALLAEYLRHGNADAHVAAAVYSAVMVGMSIGFTSMWLYARRAGLLVAGFTREELERVTRRFISGGPVYLVAVAVAFVNAIACLALHGALAAFYALAERGGGMRRPDALRDESA